MMQTQNKLFDDLARVANGAVSTVMGMKDEIDAMVRQRIERFLGDADLVTREEFDAVKAMAAKARTENEKLAARIAKLEADAPNRPTPRPRQPAPSARRNQPQLKPNLQALQKNKAAPHRPAACRGHHFRQ
ncbi:MAG: accessory factor UbiK family protein [Rhodospirillales bacterium]|nr:accessory factor UbiK family protein [Rhodospirillales bacterium]